MTSYWLKSRMSIHSQLVRRLVALRLASSGSLRATRTSSTYTKDPSAWELKTYKYFLPIQTRWSDNDQYGHVNNIVYYSYFDSVINHFLINCCGIDTNLKTSTNIGLMVDTGCSFRKPLSFPDVVLAGLKIAKLGRSSVTYQIALFDSEQRVINGDSGQVRNVAEMQKDNFRAVSGDDFLLEASAVGHCVHVFVHPESNSPHELPQKLRNTLEEIM